MTLKKLNSLKGNLYFRGVAINGVSYIVIQDGNGAFLKMVRTKDLTQVVRSLEK